MLRLVTPGEALSNDAPSKCVLDAVLKSQEDDGMGSLDYSVFDSLDNQAVAWCRKLPYMLLASAYTARLHAGNLGDPPAARLIPNRSPHVPVHSRLLVEFRRGKLILGQIPGQAELLILLILGRDCQRRSGSEPGRRKHSSFSRFVGRVPPYLAEAF